KRGNAISNIEEAIFAVQLIARLRVEFPDLVAFKHMAVITPYRAQVRLVEEHLRVRFGEEGSSLAEVSTIDGFQGREKEVIIF
ncbi:trna-splicing endonuclease positive effector-like protein, partial [Nannochloropsis gaditana CCMP526]